MRLRSPVAWSLFDNDAMPFVQDSFGTKTGTASCGIAGVSSPFKMLMVRLIGRTYLFPASLKGHYFPTSLLYMVIADSTIDCLNLDLKSLTVMALPDPCSKSCNDNDGIKLVARLKERVYFLFSSVLYPSSPRALMMSLSCLKWGQVLVKKRV